MDWGTTLRIALLMLWTALLVLMVIEQIRKSKDRDG